MREKIIKKVVGTTMAIAIAITGVIGTVPALAAGNGSHINADNSKYSKRTCDWRQ